MENHSILFIQFSANEESRTYADFKTIDKLLEGILRIYENFLLAKVQMNQGKEATEEVEYKLADLLTFVDQVFDLSALTFNEKMQGYISHGKPWLKAKLHVYLRKGAEDVEQQVQQTDEVAA